MANSPTHSRRAASTSRVEQIINISPMLLAASPSPRTPSRPPLRPPSVPDPLPRAASSTQRSPFTPRVVRAVSVPSRAPQSRQHRALSLSGHPPPPPIPPSAPSSAPNPQLVLPDPPASFPLPAYLRFSSIRDHISSEAIPFSSPNRFRFDVPNASQRPSTTTLLESDEDIEPSSSIQHASSPAQRPQLPSLPLRVPTQWSSTDHHSSLTLSLDGSELSFTGPPLMDNNQAASARANYSVPPGCGIYYYEVEVVNKGTKGHISIGFSSREMRLNKLPGWENQSWGYHADDGNVFVAERDGKPFGPTYTNKDIIGCGIDFSCHRMFYTKNGKFISKSKPSFVDCDLFPSVGMRHASESLRTNFGQAPFQFDIEGFVRTEQIRVWEAIRSTNITVSQDRDLGSVGVVVLDGPRLPTGGEVARQQIELNKLSSLRLRELVINYLVHHGYTKTAQEMKNNADEDLTMMPPPEGDDMDLDTDMDEPISMERDEKELDSRLQIISAVQRGDIDAALSQAEEYHPQVLDAEQGIMRFKLRCRKFVELLRKAAEVQRAIKEAKIDGLRGEVSADVGVFEMDLDHPKLGDESTIITKGKTRGPSHNHDTYDAMFQEALNYWHAMKSDYRHDTRPEVQDGFRRTFSLIAFDDPMLAAGEPSQLASDQARFQLAEELNNAILTLKGRPLQPKLELVYRQTALCLRQLAHLGVGAAAFADIRRELIESKHTERLQ